MSEADEYGRYSMILEWEPVGGVYVVTVPELPGCWTHGATLAEAVEHGQEAIESWIDGARDEGDVVAPPSYFELDSISSTGVSHFVLLGDDDDDALPYQERIVSEMLAKVAKLKAARREHS